MSYCVQCGSYIQDGAGFCTKCGIRANQGMPYYNNPMIKPVGAEQKEIAIRLRKTSEVMETAPKLEAMIKNDTVFVDGVEKGTITYSFLRFYFGFIIAGVLLLLASAYTLLILWAREIIKPLDGWLFFLAAVVVVGLFMVIGVAIAKSTLDEKQRQLVTEVLSMRRERLRINIERKKYLYSKEFGETLALIPDCYKYSYAMNTFANYFETGRAETMKEAFNLFEVENYRWRIEKIQMEQAYQLNSIRRAAAISAGANVANAIYNYSR